MKDKKKNNTIYSNEETKEFVFEELIHYATEKSIEDKEKVKPYFKTEDTCLYNEDCLKVMSKFPDDYFDMIYADPPYKLSNDGFTCYAGRMVSVNKGVWDKSDGFEADLKFHKAWIEESKRILKPTGSIWISGTYHSIYQCGYLLQKMDYHILNDIVWYKPNAAPNLSCTVFAASHENLIWARKDKKSRHIFNYELMKKGSYPNDKLKNENKQMRSVWAINTPRPDEKKYGKHPTQKPVDLLLRIILASTNDGDIIFDPFNGSGTTGIASKKIGNRKYIGIEIDKKHLDVTIQRYKDVDEQLTLY